MQDREHDRGRDSLRVESTGSSSPFDESFYAAFDRTPLAVTITSLDDGRLVQVNEGFVRLSGYRREEALGRTPDELRLWIEPQVRAHGLERLRAGQSIADIEARFRAKSGEERVGVIGSTVVTIGGRACVLSTVIDITDRKRAEQALRAREAEARHLLALNETILANMGEGMYAVDRHGLVTYVNAEAERLFGWRREDLLGRRMHETTHYKHPDGSAFPMEACSGFSVLRHGTALKDYEDVFIRRDGTFFPVSYSSSPVRGEGGAIIGLVVVFQDITARKRSEHKLRESEEHLRRANQMKDEFLATLSHELRTPLNAVLGWAHMLRTRTLRPEVADRAFESLERNARAQAQLVEDLLDVSRIVSGKLQIERDRVDLSAVIAGAVETVRPAADAKRVSLQVMADPDRAIVVQGDPDRLRQVVWNLLSNAVKFTPADGLVSVTLRQANADAEIIVQDTGEGIGPDFLPFVFERFRQADGTTTRKHAGLGLGLAIVRHLTEAHGGTVTADSGGPATGATFTVRLPLIPAAETAVPAGPLPLASGATLQGMRILAVDDEADARDLLRVVLESAGAEVVLAASAEDALLALSDQRFDVLVADIAMPDQDGYALLRAVRALPTQVARIPAVAVTAQASAADRELALNVGFTGHVAKPVDPTRLVDALAAVQVI